MVQLSFTALLLLCDRERRDIAGDKPPELSGSCGSHVNGTLYIFAGCDALGYTNQVSRRALFEPLIYYYIPVTELCLSER